jgi:tRNA(Arg) A34 adenosine deaminase TadA
MIDDIALLRQTIDIAEKARQEGNHPFGALLADESGAVLLTSGNTYKTDRGTGHAELNLARMASSRFELEFLAKCTLYTSIEPCSMCTGGTYWAGIGRLVFGLTEERLAQMTGDNEENLTMSLPCRQVLAAGQRDVEVVGPFPELEDEIIRGHQGFW